MTKSALPLAIAVLAFAGTLHAQGTPTLKVGDPAPNFQVGKWFRGAPITSIRKGKVYVIDFWATGCAPCVASIPKLAALAQRYKGQVSITGVSVQQWANGGQNDTPTKVKEFLSTPKGNAMTYNVVADTPHGYMATKWLNAAGFDFIPNAFVVGRDGRIAWMGDPRLLGPVLARIVGKS